MHLKISITVDRRHMDSKDKTDTIAKFRNGQPRLMKTPANEFSIQTGHSPIKNIRWPGKPDPYLDVANSSGDEETTVRKLRVSAIQ